ncbi:hypothetical protein [Streptomyces melanogenes]|uniref:hypothetical protein n=1 Tax=Streptomyces melanogenes TaxID=67326 RepID=UPI00167CA78A|nr:hypothetical protein [Streptomyces melanogenes]GGP88917.1 hypothetical protein GCM10010278_79190 [Streptomyces melanogenes]
MALFEQRADNTQIDHKLRSRKIDPARLHALPTYDLADPDMASLLGQWLEFQRITGFEFVIARSELQSFDYAPPVGVGPAVRNDTNNTITREIGGEVTVGTTKSFSVSATAEATLFSVVNVSVTTAYSQEWRRDETFKDYLTIPISPGYTCWLERETVMRRIIGGDFILQPSMGSVDDAIRLVGSITGPGVAGTLADRITVRSRQISAASFAPVAELIKATQGKAVTGLSVEDGVYQFPAELTSLL